MIKNFLSNKKRLLLTTIGFLAIVWLIWVIIVSRNKSFIPQTTPTPTNSELIKTTPPGSSTKPLPTTITFELIKTVPKDNSTNFFPVTTAVEFHFSKPVDISTLVVTSQPQAVLAFESDQNGTVLFVRSKNGWVLNTPYKITLDVVSKNKEGLPKKVTLNFKISLPKSSLLDEVPR